MAAFINLAYAWNGWLMSPGVGAAWTISPAAFWTMKTDITYNLYAKYVA